MKRKIEVDEEVYMALQREAEPFVDTPNSVLRRLLGITADIPPSKGKNSTAELPAPAAKSGEARVYRLRAHGVSASAIRIGANGMRMLTAESDLKELSSLSASNRALRRRLIREGSFVESSDGRFELTGPREFSSPSAASSVLLGRESNGRLEWKDERGEPLGDR